MAIEPLLLRVEEVAEATRLSRALIYEKLRTGELASLKINGTRRVTVEAVKDFIRRQAEPAA